MWLYISTAVATEFCGAADASTPRYQEGKTGTYMGIFNFFIVIPELVASLGFGWVMSSLLGNDRMAAVVSGGVSLAIAAGLTLLVDDRSDPSA
jgi:hypothetical protein